MNRILFYTIKALDNNSIPTDIIRLIWEHVKFYYGNKISNILSKGYYYKTYNNNRIYLDLLKISSLRYIYPIEYVNNILETASKDVTVSYIQDKERWLSKFFVIFVNYRHLMNNNEENILNTFTDKILYYDKFS